MTRHDAHISDYYSNYYDETAAYIEDDQRWSSLDNGIVLLAILILASTAFLIFG